MYVCVPSAAISVQSLVVSRQHPVRQNLQSLDTKLYIMLLRQNQKAEAEAMRQDRSRSRSRSRARKEIVEIVNTQSQPPIDDVWEDYGDDLLNLLQRNQPPSPPPPPPPPRSSDWRVRYTEANMEHHVEMMRIAMRQEAKAEAEAMRQDRSRSRSRSRARKEIVEIVKTQTLAHALENKHRKHGAKWTRNNYLQRWLNVGELKSFVDPTSVVSLAMGSVEYIIDELFPCQKYYIGITCDVPQRWFGVIGKFGEKSTPGHQVLFKTMHLLIWGDGPDIAQLEIDTLEIASRDRRCTNIGKGGERRSPSGVVSYLYIVTDQ
jgi:hypothetical protein